MWDQIAHPTSNRTRFLGENQLFPGKPASPGASWTVPCTTASRALDMIDWNKAVQGVEQKLTSWVASTGKMLPNFVVAIAVLTIFWFAALGLQRLTGRLLNRSRVNKAAAQLITTLIRVLVMAAGLMVALGVLQLDKALTSVLAGAGVVGLAVGFAFQDLAANLISGVGLAMNREKPFKIGDIVETNDEFGRVQAIDLRTSTIESLDGKLVILPNKQIYQSKLINHSASGRRRVELECGVSYGEDLERVGKVTKDAIDQVRPTQAGEAGEGSEIIWTGFGDSSINFVVRFWIDYESQKQFLMAKSSALLTLKKAFDEADIMIPFPIRTIDFGIRGGATLQEMLSAVDRESGERAVQG